MRVPRSVLDQIADPDLRRHLGGESSHKYGAISTRYNGRTYDSKAEARYAEQLDLAVRAGSVAWWIPQPLVQLDALQYRPDFLVAEPIGDMDRPGSGPAVDVFILRFVDVKGAETQRFRDVKKMWAAHGPAPLSIIRRNKLVETIETKERGTR